MLQDSILPVADIHDIPELVKLINSAYRGPGAKKGWTHEADLISGDIRIDDTELEKIINDPSAVILKYMINDTILGCVYLHQYDDVMYLGMLSVDPLSQALGIGKKILAGADEYALQKNCRSVEMNVISKRKELIAWYQKYGYHDSGRTRPFHTDHRFGTPNEPIEFIIMEKLLVRK